MIADFLFPFLVALGLAANGWSMTQSDTLPARWAAPAFWTALLGFALVVAALVWPTVVILVGILSDASFAMTLYGPLITAAASMTAISTMAGVVARLRVRCATGRAGPPDGHDRILKTPA